MKDLIIIGAGGFGRELFSAAREATATAISWRRLQNAMNIESVNVQTSSHGDMYAAMMAAPATARRTNPAASVTTSI